MSREISMNPPVRVAMRQSPMRASQYREAERSQRLRPLWCGRTEWVAVEHGVELPSCGPATPSTEGSLSHQTAKQPPATCVKMHALVACSRSPLSGEGNSEARSPSRCLEFQPPCRINSSGLLAEWGGAGVLFLRSVE